MERCGLTGLLISRFSDRSLHPGRICQTNALASYRVCALARDTLHVTKSLAPSIRFNSSTTRRAKMTNSNQRRILTMASAKRFGRSKRPV